MLYIAGKPMVQHIIEALGKNGIRNVILVVGYRKERIFDFLDSGDALGVNITYVTQNQQLGSSNALLQAQKYADEDFLVLPGNKYFQADTLTPIINAPPPAMLIKRITDPPLSSMVTIRDGSMENSPRPERQTLSNPSGKGIFTIDTRVYSLNRNIFTFLEDAPSINSALSHMIDTGLSVAAVETEGEWSDLIYPWDILTVSGSVLSQIHPNISGVLASYVSLRGKVNISDGCTIHPNSYISGPVVIGPGCTLGPHASISGPVSLGANTIIEPFSYISNSVIGNNVHIAPGAIIQDSVIDDGTFVGERFTAVSGESDIRIGQEYHHPKMGAMIGEGCQLGAGITTRPGTIVGNFCHVQDLKVLSGDIPDKSLVV